MEKYLELNTDFGFLGCRSTPVPVEPGLRLSRQGGDPLEDPTTYKRLVEKHIYLTITRPDLRYVVNIT